MIITLRLFGVLKDYFGAERIGVELPEDARLNDLLETIHAGWGDRLPDRIWDDQARKFIPPVVLMAGDADLLEETTPLCGGSEVKVLMPIAGG